MTDTDKLIVLLKRKNKALKDAAYALEQASARLDGHGRIALSKRFKDDAKKARQALSETPCLDLGVTNEIR